MNNEVKVVLTIHGIEGRTRHFAGKQKMKTVLKLKNRKTKEIFDKEVYYKIPVYEYQKIDQRVNLTQSFFNYATGQECPNWYSNYGTRKDLLRKWDKLSWKERLELHLMRITIDKGGTYFTYNILED